ERALEVLQDATYGGMRVRYLSKERLREIQGINDERSLSMLERGLPVSRVEESEGRVDEIATYIPLRPEGAMEGALRFRESLGMREAYLSGTLLRTVELSLAVALLAGFAAWRLGARLFSDPVERLLAHARRIGDGQLERESYPARSDELGLLGHEMNRM